MQITISESEIIKCFRKVYPNMTESTYLAIAINLNKWFGKEMYKFIGLDWDKRERILEVMLALNEGEFEYVKVER